VPEPDTPEPASSSPASRGDRLVSLTSDALRPLRLLVLGQAAAVGVLLLLRLPREQMFALDYPGIFGIDFVDFYRAAEEVSAGRTPYSTWRYNKPPTVAQALVPLTSLRYVLARNVFFIAQLAAIIATCWIAARSFFTIEKGSRFELASLCLVLVGLSYPVAFLLDRGNLDGFVALFVAGGSLLAMRAPRAKRVVAFCGGMLLAAGMLTKLYPLLLTAPLAIARRWWPLTGFVVASGVAAVAAPEHWLEFTRDVIWGRFGFLYHWGENASLASTLQYLSRPFGPAPTALARGPLYLSYVIYAASLLACAALDARDRARLDDSSWLLRLSLYAPFLIAMPKLSFHYGLVLFLPLCFALLWARVEARDARTRRVIDVMLVGVFLSQFPSPAAAQLSGVPTAAAIPGVGLLIVLLGAVAYRLADSRAVIARPNPPEAINAATPRRIRVPD
jgi:hypothetical protein